MLTEKGPPMSKLTWQQQSELWKTLAITYEVFIECAADQDAKGMASALKQIGRAKADLVAEGLMETTDEEVEA